LNKTSTSGTKVAPLGGVKPGTKEFALFANRPKYPLLKAKRDALTSELQQELLDYGSAYILTGLHGAFGDQELMKGGSQVSNFQGQIAVLALIRRLAILLYPAPELLWDVLGCVKVLQSHLAF
jgi:hypothetical protein